MSTRNKARTSSPALTEHRNDVTLVGRLADAPAPRSLPSGDELVSWRLIIERPAEATRGGVDVIDCTAWKARLRRTALHWDAGDLVEVSGALRRRFWRGPGGLQSRCEIEAGTATRRAAAAAPVRRRRKPE
ncbi:MAG TPA: single-stranded DNA-binding protein [Mycobacteriales bacterium]|nr:single-stranded DNA-binding protein [Mycobacteriales bacterium]